MQKPSEESSRRFPYSTLIDFWQNRPVDPALRVQVGQWIENDLRWRAHWQSLRYFDLEQAAAAQDARDLARFPEGRPREFCVFVARSAGRVLEPLVQGEDAAGGFSRAEWDAETDRCVYCRRMRRRVQAAAVARDAGLPADEPLARDMLLGPLYAAELDAATERVLAAE